MSYASVQNFDSPSQTPNTQLDATSEASAEIKQEPMDVVETEAGNSDLDNNSLYNEEDQVDGDTNKEANKASFTCASFAPNYVSMIDLLPKSISESTLQETDNRAQMLKKIVEMKIQPYFPKFGKVNVTTLDLSFSESYADWCKNDTVLMEGIISPVCQMITSVEDLILPMLVIETLHSLVVEKCLFNGIQKCNSIIIPFSAKTGKQINENLPHVVKTLMLLTPNIIECKPDSVSANLIDVTVRSCLLKKELKSVVNKNSLDLTYNDIQIIKGSRKRGSIQIQANKSKKAKTSEKSKPLKFDFPKKLLHLPTSQGKEANFTFDSFEPQHGTMDECFTASKYWQLEELHTFATGKQATIAVVDSGIDFSHSAFPKGKVVHFEDFSGNNHINSEANFHGTLCAGIACGTKFYPEEAKVEFPAGVAPDAQLVICKIVKNGEIDADNNSLLSALRWISEMAEKIDVVSLSFGSLHFNPEIAKVVTELVCKNTIVVCSASNNGHKFSQPISFPARLGHVLCIGSHGLHGKPSPFSPVGQQIDFLAPGEGVVGPSSTSINGTMVLSGTSCAAPAVAGLICLILGCIKEQYPADWKSFRNQWVMKEILRKISTSPGRHSDDCGFGALNPWQFFRQSQHILDSVFTQ